MSSILLSINKPLIERQVIKILTEYGHKAKYPKKIKNYDNISAFITLYPSSQDSWEELAKFGRIIPNTIIIGDNKIEGYKCIKESEIETALSPIMKHIDYISEIEVLKSKKGFSFSAKGQFEINPSPGLFVTVDHPDG